ncbi:MAG: heavy-metal-associated domain-containing protein [Chloroflexia bacterium]|nr:heavy-metal-associated domain-containing protein [Chloroflexia bacterium]
MGVEHVNVDLDRQSATIIFDTNVTTIDELRGAIQLAGYTPSSEAVVQG